MSKTPDPEEFYNKLKVQLAEVSIWPGTYLYKFIIPSETSRIKQINSIFDNLGAVIDTKKSRNGKYTSISIKVNMKDPDHVIAKYKEVTANVEGVISL